jgi:serine/threonine protein kinase
MVRYMARQLLAGLKYMKDKGFTHRDLKPENVCLDSSFKLKIIDWGFAAPYH